MKLGLTFTVLTLLAASLAQSMDDTPGMLLASAITLVCQALAMISFIVGYRRNIINKEGAPDVKSR